jgi:hypothetical protein
MNASLVVQEVLVAMVVAACALFSAWRLLSLRLKLRCLDALTALPLVGGARIFVSLKERTLAQLRPGCAGCAGHSTKLRSP